MVSKLSNARKPGATRTASAANPCAKRFPPSSRAIRAVSATIAAPATAGRKRSAGRDSPSSERTSQVITAINGG